MDPAHKQEGKVNKVSHCSADDKDYFSLASHITQLSNKLYKTFQVNGSNLTFGRVGQACKWIQFIRKILATALYKSIVSLTISDFGDGPYSWELDSGLPII